MVTKWIICVSCQQRRVHDSRGLCKKCRTHAAADGTLGSYKRFRTDPKASFAATQALPADECWPWPGNVDRDGYGRAGRWAAHRLAWAQKHGPIPDELTVDHVCHNLDPRCAGGVTCPHRRCVNPAHMQLASRGANVAATRHSVNSVNIAKTECVHGHPFTAENTAIATNGTRVCRACGREKQRLYRARQRESHA